MKGIALKTSILGIVILLGIITSIHPIYPDEQFLQHAGTALLLLILVIDLKKDTLSVAAFACVAIFAIIHIIGARYIYSFVPYREWLLNAFHVDINSLFHTTRNHYDRFVHIMFGILAFPYLIEVVGSKIPGKALRIVVIWCMIQSFSMFYEVFEWSLSIWMSPEAANNYNGQQGDMWDAQKDMFLAMLGSSSMCIVYLIKSQLNRFYKVES